jgi:hypothetical protein
MSLAIPINLRARRMLQLRSQKTSIGSTTTTMAESVAPIVDMIIQERLGIIAMAGKAGIRLFVDFAHIARCEQRWAKSPIISKKGYKMQYQFSQQFIGEVASLALQIALHVRGENKLQHTSVLIAKYEHEQEELASSEHPEEEWPDLVYYACQLATQGNRVYMHQVQNELERSGLSQQQIEAVTLAKYRLRASGPNSKDFEAERQAIRSALQ